MADAAETETKVLGDFEGKEVVEVGVEMPNAAGGLQDAMKFEPIEWGQGDIQFIVLRTECKKIRHEPVDKDDFAGPQRRVHVLNVDWAAPIEAKAVQKHLEQHRQRIAKAKDEAEGKLRLDLEGDGDNVTEISHRHRNDDLGDEGTGEGSSE